MARRAGVSIRTVRYYEEKGLIEPSSLTSGGIRLYSLRDLNRLVFIRRLKRLGLNIDEIKMSLGMPSADPDRKVRVEHTLSLLRMQKDRLDKEIVELAGIREEVEHSLQMAARCLTCPAPRCPENCPSSVHVL